MLVSDLSWLDCPLPVLKAKKFLANLEPSAEVSFITTDPSSLYDFQDFCKKTGHTLIKQSVENGIITTVIRRRPNT